MSAPLIQIWIMCLPAGLTEEHPEMFLTFSWGWHFPSLLTKFHKLWKNTGKSGEKSLTFLTFSSDRPAGAWPFEDTFIQGHNPRREHMTRVVRKSPSLGLKIVLHSFLCHNNYLVRILSNRCFSVGQWISASFDTKHACKHQQFNYMGKLSMW